MRTARSTDSLQIVSNGSNCSQILLGVLIQEGCAANQMTTSSMIEASSGVILIMAGGPNLVSRRP